MPPVKPAHCVTRDRKALASAIAKALDPRRKNIEPQQRLRRGEGVGYVAHRFPIKGGVSWLDVVGVNVCKNNALLSRLRGRK